MDVRIRRFGLMYVCIYMYNTYMRDCRAGASTGTVFTCYNKVACQLDALLAFILSIICLCRFNSTGSARTYPSSTTLHGKKKKRIETAGILFRREEGTWDICGRAPLPNGRPRNKIFFFVFFCFCIVPIFFWLYVFFFSSFFLHFLCKAKDLCSRRWELVCWVGVSNLALFLQPFFFFVSRSDNIEEL